MLYKDSAGGLQTEHWYNIVKEFELEFLDYRNSKIYEFIKYSSDMDINSTKVCANSYKKIMKI